MIARPLQVFAGMEGLHHWWEFGKNPKLTSEDRRSLPNPSIQSSTKRKYEARRTGAPHGLSINEIDSNGNRDRNNNLEEGGHKEVHKEMMHIIPKFCRLLYLWEI